MGRFLDPGIYRALAVAYKAVSRMMMILMSRAPSLWCQGYSSWKLEGRRVAMSGRCRGRVVKGMGWGGGGGGG